MYGVGTSSSERESLHESTRRRPMSRLSSSSLASSSRCCSVTIRFGGGGGAGAAPDAGGGAGEGEAGSEVVAGFEAAPSTVHSRRSSCKQNTKACSASTSPGTSWG